MTTTRKRMMVLGELLAETLERLAVETPPEAEEVGASARAMAQDVRARTAVLYSEHREACDE